MGNNRPLLLRSLVAAVAVLVLCGAAQAKGKTLYVHLLAGDDARGDGSYSRPYKSFSAQPRRTWRLGGGFCPITKLTAETPSTQRLRRVFFRRTLPQ